MSAQIHPSLETPETRNAWRAVAAEVVEKLKAARDVHQLSILQRQIERVLRELNEVRG